MISQNYLEFSDYQRGGTATQVKMPTTVSFKALKDSIKNPEFVLTDFAKMESPPTVNLAFQALDYFVERNKRFPRPWNTEDAESIVTLTRQLASEQLGEDQAVDISMKLVRIFAYVCGGKLCPMNGFIGGVVAQEVMKACSGKFNPIYQWLFFDAIECLPHKFNDDGTFAEKIDESDYQPLNTRYDGQVAVLGRRFQDTLGNLKYFIVGAGAIGKSVHSLSK